MTLDSILTLVAEYKYEKDPTKAGHRYHELSEHIRQLVLDKCRAIDKLDSYLAGRLK